MTTLRYAIAAGALLTLSACTEPQRETIYQIELDSQIYDVFIEYPAGSTREAAVANGTALYAAVGTKRPAYCDGTRADCISSLRNLEDRVSALGDE